MKKMIYIKLILLTLFTYFSLSTASNAFIQPTVKDFGRILSDPAIDQQFDKLKNAAANAEVYQKNGRSYFSDADIQKLNTLTDELLKILKNHEHLIPKQYKAHTYVGKYQSNSCYQYFNSLAKDSIGKTCSEFPKGFSNCDECNKYVEAVKTIGESHILHSHWWKEEPITSLVKIIKLKNGDEAYVGFELSPRH